MSMPLWLEEAPSVGEDRPPNPEVIRPLDGQGHVKLMSPRFFVLYVFPAASAFFLASSSFLPHLRLDGFDGVLLGLDILFILGKLALSCAYLALILLKL